MDIINLSGLEKVVEALADKHAEGAQYNDLQDSQKESSLHFQGNRSDNPPEFSKGFTIFNSSGKHLKQNVRVTTPPPITQRLRGASSFRQTAQNDFTPITQTVTGSPSLDQQLYSASGNGPASGNNVFGNNSLAGRVLGGTMGLLSRVSTKGSFDGLFGDIKNAISGTGVKTEQEVEQKEVVQTLQDIRDLLKKIEEGGKKNNVTVQQLKDRVNGKTSDGGNLLGGLIGEGALAGGAAIAALLATLKWGNGNSRTAVATTKGLVDSHIASKIAPETAAEKKIRLHEELQGHKEDALKQSRGNMKKTFQQHIQDMKNAGEHDPQDIDNMAHRVWSNASKRDVLTPGEKVVSKLDNLKRIPWKLGQRTLGLADNALRWLGVAQAGMQDYQGYEDLKSGHRESAAGHGVKSIGSLLQIMGKTPATALLGYGAGKFANNLGDVMIDQDHFKKNNTWQFWKPATNPIELRDHMKISDNIGMAIGGVAGGLLGGPLGAGVGMTAAMLLERLVHGKEGDFVNLYDRLTPEKQNQLVNVFNRDKHDFGKTLKDFNTLQHPQTQHTKAQSLSAHALHAAAQQSNVSHHNETHNNTYNINIKGTDLTTKQNITKAVKDGIKRANSSATTRNQANERFSNAGNSTWANFIPSLESWATSLV